MNPSKIVFLVQVSALIATVSCNPILVRWDEFALCLRRRLKRQFSPNVVCATRKMALNFRRSIRCPGCERFFHCQANYEAVFHCSQAPEAIQTAQAFSDCREFAQLGGPAIGVSDRQEANLFGRKGGDCVSEFLTKSQSFSLASLFGLGGNLGGNRRCAWNPFEGICAKDAGEVIASADYPPLPPTTGSTTGSSNAQTFHRPTYAESATASAGDSKPFSLATLINLTQPLISSLTAERPPGKAPGILETIQALNAIRDKLPSSKPSAGSAGIDAALTTPSSVNSGASTTNRVVFGLQSQPPSAPQPLPARPDRPTYPETEPPYGPITMETSGPPYIPLTAPDSDLTQNFDAGYPQYGPAPNGPEVMNPVGVADQLSGGFVVNEANGSSAPSMLDDPWVGNIASAFGSFFGKPPILPGSTQHDQHSKTEASGSTSPKSKPEPVQVT